MLGNLRKTLSALFSSKEETFQNTFEEEKPKTLLGEYIDFLRAESRDVQKLDERGCLISFKRSQETKVIPIVFHDGKLTLQHCREGQVALSKTQLLFLKEKLEKRLNYLKENAKERNWDFIGKALKQSVFGGGFDCEACKKRFSLKIYFDDEKIPTMLEKVRTSKTTRGF